MRETTIILKNYTAAWSMGATMEEVIQASMDGGDTSQGGVLEY